MTEFGWRSALALRKVHLIEWWLSSLRKKSILHSVLGGAAFTAAISGLISVMALAAEGKHCAENSNLCR